jgi:hypothetical protein
VRQADGISTQSGAAAGSTLADLCLKQEYRSGTDDFLVDFHFPCMTSSVLYSRAVGFFTSHGLSVAARGVTALIHNEG